MIHVEFNELIVMASECTNLEPKFNCMNFQDSSEDSQSLPSKTDLDNLFGPLYKNYYSTSSPEVSDNSNVNTLNNENTSSSSSIVPEETKAPRIVSLSTKQVTSEPDTPVLNENADEDSGFELIAYSDADHAGCKDDCKITSEGIQFIGDKLVSWSSKKQDCTAMSTAEAEKEYQLADLFIKSLPRERFEYLIQRIEIGSVAAFKVLETQFQMFITNRDYLNDEYVAMTHSYFIQYTGHVIIEFHDTLIQHLESIKKSIEERVQLKREYDCWVNERQMQTTEEKVDKSKVLDASSVDIESSKTESKEQDTSSSLGNDAHNDDADIRPIYDEEPMAEVQTTAKIDVFAIRQQHAEQPEFNNEGEVV
nr:uncharacterized mitochondrial protein AtMg00810-like [Tanacetum cinerariifolium]